MALQHSGLTALPCMRRYEDQGRIRPIIHRASTVEIIVPYGDPRSPFHKKCAFDVVVSADISALCDIHAHAPAETHVNKLALQCESLYVQF